MSEAKRHRVAISFDVVVEGAKSKQQARDIAVGTVTLQVQQPMRTSDGLVVRLLERDEDPRILRPVDAVRAGFAAVLRTDDQGTRR